MYTIVESTSAHIWDNSEVVDDNSNQEEQEAEERRRNFVMIEQYLRNVTLDELTILKISLIPYLGL